MSVVAPVISVICSFAAVALAGCGGESAPTAAPDTPASSATTIVTTTPTTTTTTVSAAPPPPTSTTPFRGPKPWSYLKAGDCLATLPAGDIEKVDVIPCDEPHVAEAYINLDAFDLASGETCEQSFQSVFGTSPEARGAALSSLDSVDPTGASNTSVCLALPANGGTTTESFCPSGYQISATTVVCKP